jgi:hypothetical protein
VLVISNANYEKVTSYKALAAISQSLYLFVLHWSWQCFIQAFARGGGGLCPPPGRTVGPPGKCDKKFFWGFAPDSILGSSGVFRGSVRAIAPPSERRKIFLCVCVGGDGRAGRTKKRCRGREEW